MTQSNTNSQTSSQPHSKPATQQSTRATKSRPQPTVNLQKPKALRLPTKQQAAILEHIFRYRFLTAAHLQSLLGHKQKSRIQAWLSGLVSQGYLHQLYSRDSLVAATTPALYYLAAAGVSYLRQATDHPLVELRNRYKDHTRTSAFRDHCLLIADCALSLQLITSDTTAYHWLVQSDFSGIDDELPESTYLQELQPHLYYTSTSKKGTTRYILDHAHARLPHNRLRSRLKKLLEYAAYEWLGEDPTPTILIACDELADLIYVKRRIRHLLEETYDEDITVKVTTAKQLRQEGVTERIWERIETREDW